MGSASGEEVVSQSLGASSAPSSGRSRLDSIDFLRGLVMVIMALDHVRDYCHAGLFTKPPTDPVDLTQTTPALFFTRWITHYCAPTFVFLAGTGIFLSGTRGKSKAQLSRFLLTRGLWLVFLDCVVVRLGWDFNFDYVHEFGGGVIWVIGWSMVVMSLLVFLPTMTIGVFGIAIVCFHNLLDGKSAAEVKLPEALWTVLHSPGRFRVLPPLEWGDFHLGAIHFGTGYSLLPWLGVVCCGYAFGTLYLLESRQRRRLLLQFGISLTLLFIALRATNFYGDRIPPNPNRLGLEPGAWSVQDNLLYTVFSFLNCHKYPPSLMFLLMTLGPAITALGLFERPMGILGKFFITFGRVPLFYYLLHIPLIHGLVVALDYYRYGWSPYAHGGPWTIYQDFVEKGTIPAGYGYNLPTVYLLWACVVLFLYPLCWWFAGVKQRRKEAWLSYL